MATGNDDYDDYDYEEGRYLFIRLFAQGEEPSDTGGGQIFSLNASSDLLATRWRLRRQSDSRALRSAFVV